MSERTIFSPKDVFISWNHHDVEIKNLVKDIIEEKGYSVWESDFECAGSIREACLDHIPLCGVFLILVTKNSIKSNWVRDELETAMRMEDAANRIVPVILGVPEGEYGVLTEPINVLWSMTSGIVGDSYESLPALREKIQKNVQDLSMNRDFAVYRRAVTEGRNAPCADYIPRHLSRITADGAVDVHEEKFMSELSSAFIYADGGCGKTQFLNRVLSVLTERHPKKLIFKVNCTSLIGVSDFISAIYEQFSHLSADSHYERRHFEALLHYKAKDMIVLVDAADEVGREYHLTAIGESIATFRSRFPDAVFIYTARTENAAKRLLGDEPIAKYELKRFNNSDIRRYSYIKFSADADGGNAFYVALSTIDEEIKGNPFLLKWLVEIYQRRGAVPDSVSRILDEVTDIVVGAEDIVRHPEVLKDYSENEKKYIEMLPELLKRFAYERYLADFNELKTDSRALMRDVICTYSVPKHEAEELSGVLLAYTEKRSVTVQDQFAHKIFLEYFTSCYLYDEMFNLGQIVDEEELEDYFREYYFEPYWANPTLLLLCRAGERAKKSGLRDLYHIAASVSKGEFDLLFKAANMSKNSNGIKKLLLGELMDGTLAGTYSPYGELFCYVEREGLYRALVSLEADRLPEDTPRASAVAISLVRDVCYISGGYRHLRDLTKDEDIEMAYCDAVAECPKGHRSALNALFYGAELSWLDAYVSECTGSGVYPYFFNVGAVACATQSDFGAWALAELYEDELGLYGFSRPNASGKYVGVVTLPYTDAPERELTRERAQRMTALILTAAERTDFDRLAIHRSGLGMLCLPPNIKKLTQGSLDHLGAAHNRPFKLILPYGIEDFGGALSGIPRLSELTLPDNLTRVGGISECSALHTVHFPKYTDAIEEKAFYRCSSLKRVELPEGVCEIGHYAFSYCTSLEYVSFPSSLKYIGKKHVRSAMDDMFATSLSGNFSEGTFLGCTSLAELVIPEGVREVGHGAFEGCTALASLSLPSTLTHIHDGAFWGCESLETLVIPDGVTYLGSGAFFGAKSLRSLSIGRGVESVGPYSFMGCFSLTDLTLSHGLRAIGQGAFSECRALVRVQFPESLTSIDYLAFRRCESLESIRLPESVKVLGSHTTGMVLPQSMMGKIMATDEALVASFRAFTGVGEPVAEVCEKGTFAGCISLVEAILPEELESTGNYLFDSCFSLVKIKMPRHIGTVGDGMFRRCTGLYEVLLPDSADSLGKGIFEECINIKSVSWSYPHPIPSDTFKGCIRLTALTVSSGTERIGERAFSGCLYLYDVTLPEGIRVGEDAFMGCIFEYGTKSADVTLTFSDHPDGRINADVFASLDRHTVERIRIEEGITHIEPETFRGCEMLKEIIFPSTLVSIGESALRDCVSLDGVTLPEGLEEIGNDAFLGCVSLTRVELPDSLKVVGMSAFTDCTALVYAKWTAGVVDMPLCVFSGCTSLSTLILPDNLQSLAGLLDCHSLTHLDLPDGLVSIAELRGTGFEAFDMPDTVTELVCNIFGGTFEGCARLRSIRISENVTRFGTSVFKGCSSLENIVMPPVIRGIDLTAFSGCTSLKELTLPTTVVKIQALAFNDCTSLESIRFGEKLMFICDSAFKGCTALKSVTFTSALKRIEESAFADCVSLTDIRIPDSVREMGQGAFMGCKSLKEITLPENLTHVPDYCFHGCAALESIVLPRGMSSMGTQAFGGTSPHRVTIPAAFSYLLDVWGKPLSLSEEDSDGRIIAVFREK